MEIPTIASKTLKAFVLALLLIESVAAPAFCAQSGYELSQKFAMSGDHKISIWPDSMRCEVSRMGYNLEYNQKDQSVVVWRPAEKRYARTTFQKFNKEFRHIAASASWLSELSTMKPLTEKPQKQDGLPAMEYGFEVKTTESYWRSEIGRKAIHKAIRVTLVYVDVPCSRNVQIILSKIYELPLLKGIPWQMRHISPDTNRLVFPFQTLSHAKSQKKFVAFNPKGYKEVDFSNHLVNPVINEDAASIFLP